ncbi:MAG: prephenate dehydrogenase/arogenate dehydrogenase family protein [Thermoleophilia bacterium]|nr:prephenate dehydrogenase/arogenate dehydrogenase family protein [Thermoleophilia bacterium]
MALRNITVVGTGLIGASVALAARRSGVGARGWDPDPDVLRVAHEREAVDPAATLAEAVAGADLVLVAAPVAELPHVVCEVLDLADPDCVVTDVGSTKSAVCAAARDDARFIGGHPICGVETRGPDRANAELFEGATWFLTPTPGTGPELLRIVHGFVTALGARPVVIDAGAHDRLVAVTSHLPHALANVLLNQAGATRVDGHDPLQAAGGSLRDMTRIAGANPRIWVDIFLDNREAVVAALAEYRSRIEQLEAALTAQDGGQIARWIAEAAVNRRRMLTTAYGDPGALQRLRVHLPDRPGVLAGIFQALGAERINVEDFELEHLSTDRGGTLTVIVAGEDEATRACTLLEEQGYGVVVAPVIDE